MNDNNKKLFESLNNSIVDIDLNNGKSNRFFVKQVTGDFIEAYFAEPTDLTRFNPENKSLEYKAILWLEPTYINVNAISSFHKVICEIVYCEVLYQDKIALTTL